jgi:hypothetical protein
MAVSQVQANNVVITWRKKAYREWRRANYFAPYMGESASNIIQVYRDLADGGDVLNVPLLGTLRGPGVSTGPLTGNEEPLDEYGMRVWVDWIRNAVLLTRAQMRKSAYEQLEEVRPMLSDWMQGLTRDEIILALGAIPSESPPANWGNESTAGQRVNGIIYDLATPTQRDQWHLDNYDRILYGSANSNYTFGTAGSGIHNTSLLTVDTVNDKASAAVVTLLKRKARRAVPGIMPYKDNEEQGREWYVLFCGMNAFRDLAQDPVIQNANLYARPRENGGVDKNPLFQDGDLLYRGVIIREIPELDDFLTIRAAATGGTTDVSPMFLCGRNAVALAWGQMPRPTERKEDDYSFLIGRGVEAVYGVGKVFKRNPGLTAGDATFTAGAHTGGGRLVQWGVATAFVASTPDT